MNAVVALLLCNASFMMQAPEFETKARELWLHYISGVKKNGVKKQKTT